MAPSACVSMQGIDELDIKFADDSGREAMTMMLCDVADVGRQVVSVGAFTARKSKYYGD